MQKLLQKIRDEKLSLLELTAKVTEYFKKSHDLKMSLIPKLEQAYCAFSVHNKELFDMGEFCIENQYYYTLSMNLAEFEISFREDLSRSDIKDLYLEHMQDLFEMERTKYLFRAYKRVLSDNIIMMDYNYERDKTEWM